jgi:hypothetical protein
MTNPHLVQCLRMCGAIQPLSHMPLWLAKNNFTLTNYLVTIGDKFSH